MLCEATDAYWKGVHARLVALQKNKDIYFRKHTRNAEILPQKGFLGKQALEYPQGSEALAWPRTVTSLSVLSETTH